MIMKTKSIKFILFAAALIFLSGQQSIAQTKDVNRSIDLFLNEQYKRGKLNGNVLVVKGGRKIYERSFGFADASKKTLLNKNHRFNIGSVYKEFPAVAIMQLKEKNLLRTDDKIGKYLPELPEWSKKISIKHLLQYSSGLPTIDWDSYFEKEESASEELILQDLQKLKKLEFEPGTNYLYTNYSPLLLIEIVERITGQEFRDYAEKKLFAPFDLDDTVINESYPYKDKKLMAIPFDTNFKEDDYKISVSAVLFTSTAEDLYNWFEKLDTFRIVSKESVRLLSEEAKEGENIQAPLGFADWENDELIEHSHHGTAVNYECVVRRFGKDALTIVILTNQKHRNVYEISEKIREMLNNAD